MRFENTKMKRVILLTILTFSVPSAAWASGDPEFYRVIEQSYQMLRDGSMEDAIEEGKENMRAFERLQEEKRRLQEERHRRQDVPQTVPAQLKRRR
jgi:hypothetical protein